MCPDILSGYLLQGRLSQNSILVEGARPLGSYVDPWDARHQHYVPGALLRSSCPYSFLFLGATWTRVPMWLVIGMLVYGFHGRRRNSLQDVIYVLAIDEDETYESFSNCSNGSGAVIPTLCINNSEFASCSGWYSQLECHVYDHMWHEGTTSSCTTTNFNSVEDD